MALKRTLFGLIHTVARGAVQLEEDRHKVRSTKWRNSFFCMNWGTMCVWLWHAKVILNWIIFMHKTSVSGKTVKHGSFLQGKFGWDWKDDKATQIFGLLEFEFLCKNADPFIMALQEALSIICSTASSKWIWFTRSYCLLFLEFHLFHMLHPALKPVLLRLFPSSHPRGSWSTPFDLACHFSASSPFLWYSLWPLCQPGPQVSSYWDNSLGPCREYREEKRIPCRIQDYYPSNCWPVAEQRREDLRHAWGQEKRLELLLLPLLCVSTYRVGLLGGSATHSECVPQMSPSG